MKTADITDLQVLQAVVRWRDEHPVGKWPYDYLMEELGAPFKVAYAAMERAERRGLIESGVSLRTGWPSAKGLELLKRLT